MSLVPVKIEPYLIPYLFEKYRGEEALYMGSKVKCINIKQYDSLGKYIRLSLKQLEGDLKIEEYNLVISLSDRAVWKGSIFRYADGRSNFLMLPKTELRFINDVIKNDFYNSFYFFVDGFHRNGNTSEGIRSWIDRYNLFDFEFTHIRLEKRFYRERKRLKQNKSIYQLSELVPKGNAKLR